MAYQYELVLFDLDGTLTDSGLGIMNSVQYALKKIGRGAENLEELKCFVGPPLAQQFPSRRNMQGRLQSILRSRHILSLSEAQIWTEAVRKRQKSLSMC